MSWKDLCNLLEMIKSKKWFKMLLKINKKNRYLGNQIFLNMLGQP